MMKPLRVGENRTVRRAVSRYTRTPSPGARHRQERAADLAHDKIDVAATLRQRRRAPGRSSASTCQRLRDRQGDRSRPHRAIPLHRRPQLPFSSTGKTSSLVSANPGEPRRRAATPASSSRHGATLHRSRGRDGSPSSTPPAGGPPRTRPHASGSRPEDRDPLTAPLTRTASDPSAASAPSPSDSAPTAETAAGGTTTGATPSPTPSGTGRGTRSSSQIRHPALSILAEATAAPPSITPAATPPAPSHSPSPTPPLPDHPQATTFATWNPPRRELRQSVLQTVVY
jgi:hypothetical protein